MGEHEHVHQHRGLTLQRGQRDREDVERQRDRLDILGWALEPGDVVAFHMLTLHVPDATEAGLPGFHVILADFLGGPIMTDAFGNHGDIVTLTAPHDEVRIVAAGSVNAMERAMPSSIALSAAPWSASAKS